MDIVYADERIVVAVKPAGVIATDTKRGGMPALLRQSLGTECIRTVHRLDAPVSGLMVCARSAYAAGELSRQIREGQFEKEYLAVVRGVPSPDEGQMTDLLGRDREKRLTFVADGPGKGVQEARLDYRVLAVRDGLALVECELLTGRTHQIRVSMAELGCPLLGDGKYGRGETNRRYHEQKQCLWSYRLAFDYRTDAGALEYLRGKVFSVQNIPFKNRYFP